MPGILYSLVARDSLTVLSEWTERGLHGNFAAISMVLLKKINNRTETKMSYIYDNYIFHYSVTFNHDQTPTSSSSSSSSRSSTSINGSSSSTAASSSSTSQGLISLCMCEKEFNKQIAFQFLANVDSSFRSLFGTRWYHANAYQYNADFKSRLESLMVQYGAMKDAKISQIQDQLIEIKDIMTKNIELVLDRGEKIEILVDKSEQMEQSALKFSKNSSKLKRRMWWKNTRWIVCIVFLVLVIIYIILAVACKGPALPSCVNN